MSVTVNYEAGAYEVGELKTLDSKGVSTGGGGSTVTVSQLVADTYSAFLSTAGPAGDNLRSQGFLATATGTVAGVSLDLYDNLSNSPTADFKVSLQGDSSNHPDGTPIASTLINASALPRTSSTGLSLYTFDSPGAVTDTNKYWIVLELDSIGGGLANLNVGHENPSTYPIDYSFSNDSGAGWTNVSTVAVAFSLDIAT